MKLLILTQKVDRNDSVLGFMHGWITEFARVAERVTVICLEKGEHDLPANVTVLSLGKEVHRSRIQYLWRFYMYIIGHRGDYDVVFVHMNQIYTILGGVVWKLLGKTTGLWYAHGHVPFSLRVAEKMTDLVFTSSARGFRLPSKKVHIVGQGININTFKPEKRENEAEDGVGGDTQHSNDFPIVAVGRISPVKDFETLIIATALLVERGRKVTVDIIGGIGSADQQFYMDSLKAMVRGKGLEGTVRFLGPIANTALLAYLQKYQLSINTSHTGSMDKTVLESMAIEQPILTCNEAYIPILQDIPEHELFLFEKKNPEALANQIEKWMDMNPESRGKHGISLRNLVIRDHNLQGLVRKIITTYEQFQR